MVCVPCIFIPILLFIWHKFIQPYVLRFWNPWAAKDDKGNAVAETQFPFTCSGGACPFPKKNATATENDTGDSGSDKPSQSTKELKSD